MRLENIEPAFREMVERNETEGSWYNLINELNRFMSSYEGLITQYKILVDMDDYIKDGVEEFYISLSWITVPIGMSSGLGSVCKKEYLFMCGSKFKGRF